MIDCKACELWREYKEDDDVDNSSREPNNCSTWLCNDKCCPLDSLVFIRNTHDKRGNFKWSNDYLYVDQELEIKGLGVHALNRSGQPTEYLDYILEHKKYAKSFPEYEMPNDFDLLEDLKKLVNIGLVLARQKT